MVYKDKYGAIIKDSFPGVLKSYNYDELINGVNDLQALIYSKIGFKPIIKNAIQPRLRNIQKADTVVLTLEEKIFGTVGRYFRVLESTISGGLDVYEYDTYKDAMIGIRNRKKELLDKFGVRSVLINKVPVSSRG